MEEPLFDHLTLVRGDTLTQGYEWAVDLGGGATAPVDLTGWAAEWLVLSPDGTTALSLTTANGKLAAPGVTGAIAPASPGVGPPDTNLAVGLYGLVVRVTDPDGRRTTLVVGKCEVVA